MATKKDTKTQRSDSAAAVIRAMNNAAEPDLRPPQHVRMTVEAEPFFRDIVCARSRDEWNALQLTVAAQLAQCFADQAEEELLLAAEGRISKNDRGTAVCNPRVMVLEQFARKEMAFMRTLQMGGRVPGPAGDARNQAGARAAESKARKLRAQVAAEDDQLLA